MASYNRVNVNISRREMLPKSIGFAALLSGMQRSFGSSPYIDAKSRAPFVDPLPIPPVANSGGLRKDPHGEKVPYYRVSMRACQVNVHRDLNPTSMWGYQGCPPGPTIVSRKDQPVFVDWSCELPREHFLPIDH